MKKREKINSSFKQLHRIYDNLAESHGKKQNRRQMAMKVKTQKDPKLKI